MGTKPRVLVLFYLSAPTGAIESSASWRERVGVQPSIQRANDRIMRSKNALKSFVASRLFESPIERDTLLKILHWAQILQTEFGVCAQGFPGTIGQCDSPGGFAEVEVALGERNLRNGQTGADRFHDGLPQFHGPLQ
jgi:hypothetical protein